jgi:tRNA dimethylallyltransferase
VKEFYTPPLLSPQREREEVPLAKKRVIVIAGPTASGKSALSLLLAQAIGGEIISADSMQVYRGLDIGTAKMSANERMLIAHHLIDICDLSEVFNAAEFTKEAEEAIQDITLRDNVPIVVGGTGFYIHSLLYGPPAGPPSVPEVRQQLEQQMRELGSAVLYERLQMLDPTYAETISEGDRHKIVRALEIIALSERRVSDFPKRAEQRERADLDFRCWFLYYPREELYSRIELRCDEMVRQGFLQEVEEMLKQGLKENPTASQAIGYRQALEYLSSPKTREDWERFLREFKRASRQYAKRQFTWFRKEPLFRWLNIQEFEQGRLKELILQDYEQGS